MDSSYHHLDHTEAHLPPGFRFHPTDEELITYYLLKKVLDSTFTGRAIAEVDLNKSEPWELPGSYYSLSLPLFIELLLITHLVLSIVVAQRGFVFPSNFVVACYWQRKLKWVRKSGTSSAYVTGSTQLGYEPIGLLKLVTGKPLGKIERFTAPKLVLWWG